jgi:DNA-directed RNA polymerase specialized sigma24 family protein
MNDRDDLFRDDKLWRSVYAEVDKIVNRKKGVSKEVLEDIRQVALMRIMKYPERSIKNGVVHYGYCQTIVQRLFADHWKKQSKCGSDARIGSDFDKPGSLDGVSSQRFETDLESSAPSSDIGFHDEMPGSLADEAQSSGHLMHHTDMTTRGCLQEDPREFLEVDELISFWMNCYASMSPGIRKKVLGEVLKGVTDRQEIAAELGGDLKAIDQALSYSRKYLKLEAQAVGLL